MRLTESLPETVEIAGEQYAIKTDFRDILRYDEIIRGQSDGEAVLKAINILLGEEVLRKPNMRADDIVETIGWFVKCGDINKKILSHVLYLDLIMRCLWILALIPL